MKSAAAQREEDLFEAARERRTPAERKAFLDRACVNEPELRARLDGLLAAGDEAEPFSRKAAR